MAESTGAIIVSPKRVATGDPAGQALENLNTAVLGDGALCYVSEGAGKGPWQLDKNSTDAANGVTIVAPISGPGRWYLQQQVLSPTIVDTSRTAATEAQTGEQSRWYTMGDLELPFTIDLPRTIPGIDSVAFAAAPRGVMHVEMNLSTSGGSATAQSRAVGHFYFQPGGGIAATRAIVVGGLTFVFTTDGGSPANPRITFAGEVGYNGLSFLEINLKQIYPNA